MQFLISVLPSCGVGKAQHLRNHRTQIEQMLSSRQDRRRPFLFFFWVVVAIKSRVETGPFILWCSSENVSSVGWSLCFYLKERRRGVGGGGGARQRQREKSPQHWSACHHWLFSTPYRDVCVCPCPLRLALTQAFGTTHGNARQKPMRNHIVTMSWRKKKIIIIRTLQ